MKQTRDGGCDLRLRRKHARLCLTGQANVTSPAGTFSYQLVGQASRLSTLTLPNTSYITNHYDSVARLLFTKLNNSSHTTLNKHEYVYNTGNQRIKHTRPDNSHLTFSYDPIGQLTIVRATNSGGTLLTGETKGYAYDAAWNLNRRTNNSSGSTHTFSVNGKNELTDGPSGPFTYDPNGNLTNYNSTSMTYAYDDENQLIRWEYVGTAKKEFAYDGPGRLRVRNNCLGTVTEPSQPGERSLRRLSVRKLNGQPLWVCLLAR